MGVVNGLRVGAGRIEMHAPCFGMGPAEWWQAPVRTPVPPETWLGLLGSRTLGQWVSRVPRSLQIRLGMYWRERWQTGFARTVAQTLPPTTKPTTEHEKKQIWRDLSLTSLASSRRNNVHTLNNYKGYDCRSYNRYCMTKQGSRLNVPGLSNKCLIMKQQQQRRR